MPVNVVKDSGDEQLWAKAKAVAEKEGKAGNYAYIMGIFQKMTSHKSLSKSFSVPAQWRNERIPGQVPGQGGQRLDRLLDMPKEKGGLAILEHTEPRLTPESIVKGLGFSLAEENEWRGWLGRNMGSASNEVVARKSLYERFIENRTPPELRRAIFQRSMMYFSGLRKSFVQIVTVDEILEKSEKLVGGEGDGKTAKDFDPAQLTAGVKVEREHSKDPAIAREIAQDHLTEDPRYYEKLKTIEKAEARGGSYHRRVKSGDGYRYYYDPDKYHEREDAHIDGDTALKKRLQKMLVGHVTKAGEKGCDHTGLKAIAERFGVDKVAGALKEATAEGGPLKFDKGLFTLRGALQKSERFVLTR